MTDSTFRVADLAGDGVFELGGLAVLVRDVGENPEAGGDEEGAGALDVAGAGETGIGHEKNGGPANLTHASGQFTQRPGTKDELGCGAGGERADHGIGIGNREIGHQESKI